MGVKTRIVLYAENAETGRDAAAGAYAVIARLDDVMSDYRHDSELMRLCEVPRVPPIPISRDLFDVLAESIRVSEMSDGAFDVTIGPCVTLWREARRIGQLPSDADLKSARKRIGSINLILDPRHQTAQLLQRDMKLDLGGIGKGFAAQRAVDWMCERGFKRCLVALAGDIVISDPPPNDRGWRVETPPGEYLTLSNCAVSTSGDSEQFIDIGGVRYSHIIDPRTGIGLTNQIVCTIVAPRGELADALSTTVCVLGRKSAAAFLSRFDHVAAIIHEKTSNEHAEEFVFDPKRLLTK